MRQLYITAHPHYAACFCGGTILNHTRQGDEVFVVSLSAGELMTNRVSPPELAKINSVDAEKAGKVLGIKETRILGIPDTEIENTPELRMTLNNIIREIKADVLVTHWPLDTHPDYRNTAQAAIDASFLALIVSGKWAGDRSSHWTSKAWGFECPALFHDQELGRTAINREICVDCGLCVQICPKGAIKEVETT